jgi:hypothetical protein
VQEVPKKSTEYTAAERAAFPRLFKPGDNHLQEWADPIEPERWVEHPSFKRGEQAWDMKY